MSFPEDFLWGVSTSGFQFEMGDPAGSNIDSNTDWYKWVHDEVNIRKGIVSGDMPEYGINYWDLYKRDHEAAVKIGLNAYRVGIEWSRIFPQSTVKIEVGLEKSSDGNISKIDVDGKSLEELDNSADKEALNHYSDIIKDLRSKEFKVFACLNHFTLPLWIHDPITVRDTKLRRGPKGWIDEDTIVEFTKYASYLAWKLSDVVDYWVTLNEPMVVAEIGYMVPSGFPPGISNLKAAKKAALNMVIAHARAYDAIKELDTVKADDNSSNSASIGLIHNVIPTAPLDEDNELHIKAANFIDNVHNHFFPRSVSYGWLDWNLNGVKESGEMKEYLKQRIDWLGLNYYTRAIVKGRRSILARLFTGIPIIPEMVKNYGLLCLPDSTSAEGMPTSDFGWEIYPEGLLRALKAMRRYDKPLYITENGIADEKGTRRPTFIVDHLKVLERAKEEEDIDIQGYFHWSLTDNYEWSKGFHMKFGLYAVDLKSKDRIERDSVKLYKRITTFNH